MHLIRVDKMMEKEKNKSKVMRFAITLTLTIAVLFFLFAPVGFAQIENPLVSSNFQEFLERIIGFLFWVGLALAPVFVLIAAFYFMTAAGNPAQIETGKRIITYTVIGLLVIIMARGAVAFLQRMF